MPLREALSNAPTQDGVLRAAVTRRDVELSGPEQVPIYTGNRSALAPGL